jgi:hypothetical protein
VLATPTADLLAVDQYRTHSRMPSAVFLNDDWNDTTCVHSPMTFFACRLLLK